jgi:diguanylate cyclase (GGDEF)-like protein
MGHRISHTQLAVQPHAHHDYHDQSARSGRRRAGQRLQELSRSQDWCFRYGGDEFVILLPETGAEAALEQATTLNRSLMETDFRMKNDLELRVSASLGVATAPADATSVHAILGAADTRMYWVKANGRGAVRGV